MNRNYIYQAVCSCIVVVLMVCSTALPTSALAGGGNAYTALIPTPAEPHGYTLLASFSTSTITLTTTIPDSGWSYTNAADTWLVVSLDLRYRSSGGVVSTQTVEVPATAFLTISGESVTFRVSTTTLAAHSAYTNVCNQCSPDGGTPGCKCDNVVAYRVVSAHATPGWSSTNTAVVDALKKIKDNIDIGNGTLENQLVFTRSSNPADMYNISTSNTTTSTFAAVPVTTLNNTGDYTALYSCMGAGLVPAAIASSEENTQVQQLSPSRSLLLDIIWSRGLLKWQYDNTNLGWCFWGGCRSLSGRFLNLENPASAAVPLVFDSITGLWADGGGHVYEGVLCTVGSTTPVIETTIILLDGTPATTPTTFPPIGIFSTTTTTTPTTTTTTTTTPNTTTTASTTTTTTTTVTTYPSSANTTTTHLNSTNATTTPTTTFMLAEPSTPPPPTTPTPTTGRQYHIQITLASQVHDVEGIKETLSRMFTNSMSGPQVVTLSTSQLTTAPVVTILELVPGSTVVVAQADNVDESDMDRLRADIETGASELVTVFGAIASSLRIDRIFPSHPGLAAAATVLLLVTMLACVVACVVGCVMYTRESIRRTNELREGVMSRKNIYTTENNPASYVFAIEEGQLFVQGQPIECKHATPAAMGNVVGHEPVSGPLDSGIQTVEGSTTNQLRVDSANMIWAKEVVEADFPTPRSVRTVQWTPESSW